jgi:hypothetical protein
MSLEHYDLRARKLLSDAERRNAWVFCCRSGYFLGKTKKGE